MKAEEKKAHEKKNAEKMADLNFKLNHMKGKQDDIVEEKVEAHMGTLQNIVADIDNELSDQSAQNNNLEECIWEMDEYATD